MAIIQRYHYCHIGRYSDICITQEQSHNKLVPKLNEIKWFKAAASGIQSLIDAIHLDCQLNTSVSGYASCYVSSYANRFGWSYRKHGFIWCSGYQS